MARNGRANFSSVSPMPPLLEPLLLYYSGKVQGLISHVLKLTRTGPYTHSHDPWPALLTAKGNKGQGAHIGHHFYTHA